jgi:hypothetical protein
MAQWTGDLGGPIVAHFTINFVNLRYITRTDFEPARAPTPRPLAPTPPGGTETSTADQPTPPQAA